MDSHPDSHPERRRLNRRHPSAMEISAIFMMFNFATSVVDLNTAPIRLPCRPPRGVPVHQPVSLSWLCAMGSEEIQKAVKGRRRRRFWAALRDQGVWEKDFLQNYSIMSVEWRVPDFENEQYHAHLRMGKTEFWRLHEMYGKFLSRRNTNFRQPITSHKRLALTLHWLSHGGTFAEVARLYAIGKSTAVSIVHHTISVLCSKVVTRSIRFPEGAQVRRTMQEFEELCHLERCAGAVDGTFMKINKPKVDFADSYWCYKKHCAIIILGTVDACGIFTNVNAGRAGSAGDAAVYATSRLYRKIDQHKWLTVDEAEHEKLRIEGTYIRPYLVGDSAFPLSATLMKCYDDNNALEPHQRTFNHRLIRTRRVVEQAFGRLKGRYHILVDNNLSDPHFASEVALVCCALHNICERWNCPMEDTWLVNSATYNSFHPGPNDADNEDYDEAGWAIRNKLARHVHRSHPVQA